MFLIQNIKSADYGSYNAMFLQSLNAKILTWRWLCSNSYYEIIHEK